VVILNMMAFLGVDGSRSMGDINPVNPDPGDCFGAGDGVKGEPRMGSVASRDERQARLFWRSRGGGRREMSVRASDGLKRVREGERRDPNDSSLEVGDDGLVCGGSRRDQPQAPFPTMTRRVPTNPRTPSIPFHARPASNQRHPTADPPHVPP
jgi:hypothetical protein